MWAEAPVKRVWSGGTLADTTHFKNLLEQAGIDCVIKNRHLGGGIGDLPIFDASPELWVLDERQSEHATTLLRELVRPLRPAASAAAWHCRACDADNEAQFAACWRCGALDEGSAS